LKPVNIDADAFNADWIKDVGIGGSSRNHELALLYRTRWRMLWRLVETEPSLSCPYLAWVHPDYELASTRLIVVGRETNGWADRTMISEDPLSSVRSLMQEYRDFALGSRYKHAASFWKPVHSLYRRLNPDGPPLGFVALNASIVDQCCDQPVPGVRDAIIKTGLLADQIRILDPDVVVFHTGPPYEEWLDSSFPGFSRVGDMALARVSAPGLPDLSFRTYHPRFLSLSKQLTAVQDGILSAVQGAQQRHRADGAS
jgi:hypothetical protein